jgi:hypothetical protein
MFVRFPIPFRLRYPRDPSTYVLFTTWRYVDLILE